MFLILGTLLTAGNYLGILYAWRRRVGFSCIPLLGGLFGCTGFLLLPRIRLFALIPPLVDPGCVLMLLALLVRIIKKDLGGSR